jgi:hypothetical protein
VQQPAVKLVQLDGFHQHRLADTENRQKYGSG